MYLLSKYNLNIVTNIQNSINKTPYLGVSEFTNYCSSFQVPYTDLGRIETQLTCSQLLGLPVQWKGKVKKTRMSRISNPISAFTSKLPSVSFAGNDRRTVNYLIIIFIIFRFFQFLSKHLNCWFGEEYPLCSKSFRLEFCKTLSKSCHISNWNR